VNFGTILQSVTSVCAKKALANQEQDAKMLAKTFINFVNIKEVLHKQFNVFTRLESSYMADRRLAEMFVNETVSALDGMNFKDVQAYNTLLESKCKIPAMKSSQLNMDIGTVIRYRLDKESVDPKRYVESFDRVVQHVNSLHEDKDPYENLSEMVANSELKFLKPKHVIRIALGKFNSKYSNQLNEDDRKVFFLLKENDQGKIADKQKLMIAEIESLLVKLGGSMGEELSSKAAAATKQCKENQTADGLLDTYELVCELRNLREKDNEEK